MNQTIEILHEFVLNTVRTDNEYKHAYEVAKKFENDIRFFTVAMLHDIVRDGYKTIEELTRIFELDEEQVLALDAITRTKDFLYLSYIRRCRMSPMATKIKIEDIQWNMCGSCRNLSAYWPQVERYLDAYKILIGAKK